MISVIIPSYNRAHIIGYAINSIGFSKEVEIIVVDDASTDGSVEVIKNYPVKLITLAQNKGQANARNVGAKHSRGDILVFMDSDVIMPKEGLSKICHALQLHDAVSSTPRFKSVFSNLCSSHFNWRVNYNYSKLPHMIDFVYGSLFGVRKEMFDRVGGFKEFNGIEDDEFGHDIILKGGTILFDESLEITHCKGIRLWGLLKNDFKRTLARVDYMFRRGKFSDPIKTKRFISTPSSHLASPIIIALFWITLNPIFLGLFLWCYWDYFRYIRNHGSNPPFLLPLLILDMTVVFIALMIGVLRWLVSKIL